MLHQLQDQLLTCYVKSILQYSPEEMRIWKNTTNNYGYRYRRQSSGKFSPIYLALKHHQWVQEEIETLERAGVITKSMSPWASPIVVVPKNLNLGNPQEEVMYRFQEDQQLATSSHH